MLLSEKAYAKINLYLDVTGIRDDGYHNIKSIMQTVDLHDTVTVEAFDAVSGNESIALTCSESAVPLGEKNIAYRAAMEFFRTAGIGSYNCRIHIEKNIPMEAGLAGGSTDAAAVLRILRKLYGVSMDTVALCEIGRRLGADVPFCIVGGTCLCEGIGESLTYLPSLPDCYIVIARGGEGISTPAAYGLVDKHRHKDFSISGGNFNEISKALEKSDITAVAGSMYNIFEDVILPAHSVASRLRDIMTESGAIGAMMSGSGPSVFGIFDDKKVAERAVDSVSDIACGFLCMPCGAAEE